MKLTKLITLLSLMVTLALPATAAWEYHPQKDAISDENRSVITLNCTKRLAMLGVGYKEDGLNVLLAHDDYMSGDSDNEVIVVIRFDQDPPSDRFYCGLSTSSEMLYFPMNRVKAAVESLKKAKVLTIRIIDPADGETWTYQFNVEGFAEAFKKL